MDIILLIAACIVSYLIFTWLVNVLKATVRTAVTIAVLVLVLQILFGIGPNDLMQTLNDFWNGLLRLLFG